jgi:predicted  nucleic acid-binding Zn-ribbon protein
MIKFIEWFFSSSTKPDFEDYLLIDDLYNRVAELEEKIVKLQEENIETTNELYRLENSLDARIDILADHCRINYDV